MSERTHFWKSPKLSSDFVHVEGNDTINWTEGPGGKSRLEFCYLHLNVANEDFYPSMTLFLFIGITD